MRHRTRAERGDYRERGVQRRETGHARLDRGAADEKPVAVDRLAERRRVDDRDALPGPDQSQDVLAALSELAHFGDVDEGRTAIRALTDGTPPIADGVRPMYYPELQEIFGRMPFGLRNYWSGRFLRELSDGVIDLTTATFEDAETMGGVLLECLHGAARRVPPDATAFAGREASHNATFIATWTDPAEDEHRIAAARAYSAALAPWSIGEGYVNYASEMPTDTPETERMQRLRRIKREYDPENRFRFNHNIEPGAS